MSGLFELDVAVGWLLEAYRSGESDLLWDLRRWYYRLHQMQKLALFHRVRRSQSQWIKLHKIIWPDLEPPGEGRPYFQRAAIVAFQSARPNAERGKRAPSRTCASGGGRRVRGRQCVRSATAFLFVHAGMGSHRRTPSNRGCKLLRAACL